MMNILFLFLKILITLVFVGAAWQKFTGKVAANWERWGHTRQFMYAAGIAELIALVLFWWPGMQLVGAAALGLILLGALVTLIRHREQPAHFILPGLTLLLVLAQFTLPALA
jgi:hypothetical protein